MTSLEMIILVARRLGTLRDEVAFLGGATTPFLITDPVYPQVRPTLDVDHAYPDIAQGSVKYSRA